MIEPAMAIMMHAFHTIPLLAEFRAVDLIPVAGIMMLVTGMFMMMRKRRRMQQTNPKLTPMEQLERNRQARGMRGDLEELMVEIEQLSKRLAAQIEARTTALDVLLRQADARIAELKRIAQGNGHAGESSNGSAAAPTASTAPAAMPAAREPGAEQPDDPLSQTVYRLADQGLDAPAIAAKTKEHVGKIELILALRSAR